MIHIQLTVDDGESLRIDCIFVAVLVRDAHGAMMCNPYNALPSVSGALVASFFIARGQVARTASAVVLSGVP